MEAISREAHTSKVYTNHCLRATTIQALDSEGFAAIRVNRLFQGTSLTDKLVSNTTTYARVEESNKRKMSLCLSDKFTANTILTVTAAITFVNSTSSSKCTCTTVTSTTTSTTTTSSSSSTAVCTSPKWQEARPNTSTGLGLSVASPGQLQQSPQSQTLNVVSNKLDVDRSTQHVYHFQNCTVHINLTIDWCFKTKEDWIICKMRSKGNCQLRSYCWCSSPGTSYYHSRLVTSLDCRNVLCEN